MTRDMNPNGEDAAARQHGDSASSHVPAAEQARSVQDCTSWLKVHKQLEKKARAMSSALKLPEEVPNASAIEAMRAELHEASVDEEAEVMHDLAHMKRQVTVLKKRMESMHASDAYLATLKELMDGIQEALGSFKSKQRARYQELQRQSDLHDRSLELFIERMDAPAWNEAACPPVAAPPACQQSAASSAPATSGLARRSSQGARTGLLPEVIEFDAYAEEFGPVGNWHADDHKEFLKILKSHRGDYSAAVLACCECMVGFDRLDIIAHARWHSRYEELALRKKIALQAWRQSRDIAAEAQRCNAVEQVNAAQRPASSTAQQQAREREERQYTKAMLAEWKASKVEAQQAAAARAAAASAAKVAKEAQAREARQRELAEVMRQRRAQQAEQRRREAEAPKPLAAALPARPRTAEQSAALQERSSQMLERRKAAVLAKQAQAEERAKTQQKLLASVKVSAKADPGRLFKATQASARREAAEKENEHVPKDSGYIRYVPHKAALRR